MDSTPQTKPVLHKPPGYRDPNSRPPRPPPRKPVLPPSFQPKQKRRGCCRICCCTCCIVILVLILVLLICGGVFYLIFEPSLPEFHLGSFRVAKLNVTESSDGAFLDAETVARVEVKNRNAKMAWRVEESRVEVWAENGEVNLGWTKVEGARVKAKGVVGLKAETSVRRVALDERQRRRMKGAWESKALRPTVEVRTRTGFGFNGWDSPTLPVTLVCAGFTLRQLQNSASPRCHVTLLK